MSVETLRNPAASEADEAQRREHPRYASPPVALGEDWAAVQNISVGGICLEAHSSGDRAPLKPGDRCSLTLADVQLGDRQELRAEVVWRRQDQIGLRWVGLDDEQKVWLGKHSREWRDDALLARLTQVLAATGQVPDSGPAGGASLPASDGCAHELLAEPGLWLSGPRPTESETEPWKGPETPLPAPSPLKLLGRRAVEALPWALAAVATGLFAALAALPLPSVPSRAGAAVQARLAAPYLGRWNGGPLSGRVVSESFQSDGTWSAVLAGEREPRSGHWREEDGVLTVCYLHTDDRAGALRLVSRRRWWFIDPGRSTLALVSLAADGSVKATLSLHRP